MNIWPEKITFWRKFLANLQEAIDKAIELEASFQLEEGVNMAHPIHNPKSWILTNWNIRKTLSWLLKKLLTTE